MSASAHVRADRELPALVSGMVLRIGPWSVRVTRRLIVVAIGMLVVLLAVGALTLVSGTLDLQPGAVFRALIGVGEDSAVRTVRDRRLPRLLAAILVGGALGVAGAVFQSLSRNPLGSPDFIGFTAGASTAAVTAYAFFGAGPTGIAIAAMAGALGTAIIVYTLSRNGGVSGGVRLVLVGVGVGAVMTALTNLALVRTSLDTATVVQQWLIGTLTGRGWDYVLGIGVVSVIVLPTLLVLARSVDLMEMGDQAAGALGVAVERRRLSAMLAAVLLVGAATATAGPISFIALAAPQIVRRLIPRGGNLLVPAFLMGALLLAAADLAAQTVDIGLRTPVGLVTSVFGSLYLLWMLGRRL